MMRLRGYKGLLATVLCLGLATPTLAQASRLVPASKFVPISSLVPAWTLVPNFQAYANAEARTSGHTSASSYTQYLHYEPALFYSPQLTTQPSNKPSISTKKEDKKSPPKIHPRKKLLEDAPLHTQRAWLYSAVIPGLGQLYNKSYWEIPVIYGVFGLLAWGAIYNHDEYTTTKRELIEKCKPRIDEKTGNVTRDKESQYPNLVNYMNSRKRDRTIFVAAMFVWYLLNVFEAYVGGTLQTFDVSDDLAVVIQPSDSSSTPQNTSIALSFSLQSKDKDEDRDHWVW